MSSESDPVAAKEPNKDYPWYHENIDGKINPEVLQVQITHLLETYSQIPRQQVKSHIYSIRKKAWNIRPYPCTGLGLFLQSSLAQHSAMPAILSLLQSAPAPNDNEPEPILLDIGCHVGLDVRTLTINHDIPASRIYATDIVNHWDLGLDFFRDKDTCRVTYIESDILHPTPEITALFGKVDVVSITHVLHQWGWDTQIEACKVLCRLSKVGSLVVGYQGATSDMEARTKANRESGQPTFTLHDVESFGRMWEVVGRDMGMEWEVEAVLRPWEEVGSGMEEVVYMGGGFCVDEVFGDAKEVGCHHVR